MKRLLTILFVLFSLLSQAQSVYPISADSVKISKTGGNAELILMNAGRNKTGAFLRNKGNGRTEFAYALDNAYWSGDTLVFTRGTELLKFKVGGASGGGPVSGYTFNAPLVLQGNVVSLNGWNKPQWDSVYNWWKSNPFQNYYDMSQIDRFFDGILPMDGYNKARWDSVYNLVRSGAFVTKTQLDTSSGGALLEYTNGLLKTGNKVIALTDNALWNAKKLQGYLWSPVQPQQGDVPVFNASTQRWEFGAGSGVSGEQELVTKGNAQGRFALPAKPAEGTVKVWVNGVRIPPSCWTLTVNSIQVNFNCIEYEIDTKDDIIINYK